MEGWRGTRKGGTLAIFQGWLEYLSNALLDVQAKGALRAIVLSFGELIQELCDIPLAAATARDSTRPSGNGIHIQALLEQALNIALRGAAAMAHDFICRAGILHIHEWFFTSGLVDRPYSNVPSLTMQASIKKTDVQLPLSRISW